MKYCLIVAYDGTRYFGWQATAFGPSIQSELEAAARSVLRTEVACEAASRTDRGVHAKAQMVQLDAPKTLEPERLWMGMNSHLPPDIRIQSVRLCQEPFHVTLDAVGKTYCYYLCTGHVQLPFHRKFSWHYPRPLDLASMRRSAATWLGTHDFSAFTTEPQPNSVRTLHRLDLIQLPEERLCIAMSGDRFLYKMARTLAGTLANIGSGKLPEEGALQLLRAPERKLAGVTAPAHGLTLHAVHYSVEEMARLNV